MTGWLDTIVQGILLGGLYALFATGLSLIFGIMRLVNLAHGDLIVFAAFLILALVRRSASTRFVAALVAVPLMFVRRLRACSASLLNRTLGTDILPPLLVTFGLSIIIQNGLLEVFSADTRRLPVGELAGQLAAARRRHRGRRHAAARRSAPRSLVDRRASTSSSTAPRSAAPSAPSPTTPRRRS